MGNTIEHRKRYLTLLDDDINDANSAYQEASSELIRMESLVVKFKAEKAARKAFLDGLEQAKALYMETCEEADGQEKWEERVIGPSDAFGAGNQ